MKNIVPYTKVRDQLCTLTAINCINRKFPYNLIGHTAVLYKDRLTDQLMLLESTTLNKSTGVSGVQLTPFGIWLARYPGKVYARVPKFGDSSNVNLGHIDTLAEKFIRENLGTSYPDLKTWSGKMKLALSALDFNLFGKDWLTYTGDDEGIFCTMLFVKLLQACECFQMGCNPQEYEPDDIRGNSESFERKLQGILYLPEVQLK